MLASNWEHLPLRTRDSIVAHVERSIATYRSQEIEDVARWACEALLKDRCHTDAYHEGYEDGRSVAISEARAS